MKLIKEATRMQKLAGLIKENEEFAISEEQGILNDFPDEIEGNEYKDYTITFVKSEEDPEYKEYAVYEIFLRRPGYKDQLLGDKYFKNDEDVEKFAVDFKIDSHGMPNLDFNQVEPDYEADRYDTEEYEDFDVLGERMQKLAGLKKESGIGAAVAERELDGDASRQMHEEDGLEEEVKEPKLNATLVEIMKAYRIIADAKDNGILPKDDYYKFHDVFIEMYNKYKNTEDLGEGTISEGIDTSKIENIELDDVDTSDYPDFADAYISYAEWSDTGEPLSEDELDQLNDDTDFVYDQVMEYIQ